MERIIIGTHTQVLSKQCCFSNSQDSLEELYTVSSLKDSCKDQSLAVSEAFTLKRV